MWLCSSINIYDHTLCMVLSCIWVYMCKIYLSMDRIFEEDACYLTLIDNYYQNMMFTGSIGNFQRSFDLLPGEQVVRYPCWSVSHLQANSSRDRPGTPIKIPQVCPLRAILYLCFQKYIIFVRFIINHIMYCTFLY